MLTGKTGAEDELFRFSLALKANDTFDLFPQILHKAIIIQQGQVCLIK
ncbi:MAG: hypothetical protein COA61_006465 [Zetaproteobacteria bacterium]|nr:hypothetical protein [Zetaproteobacteria bacterium]